MSYLVTSWVLQESEAKLGARLVLLVLAEHCDDDGSKAFPAVYTITRKSRLSERAVRDALRRLEGDGMVVNTGATRNGTRVYTVVGPFNRGAVHDTKSVSSSSERGADSAPDSVLTQKASSSSSRKPGKVGKAKVTDAEHDATDAVLAHFNAVFETKYASVEFRTAIVGRLREHPELSLDDHKTLIEKMQRRPWWNGEASPAVIYGNGKVFERCLHQRDDDAGDLFAGYDS